ncbi:hypothetical protein OH77DRAFT_1521942 [Trametes cingulata]|nr:hypothetical protein OH77DRAFT_1521942 [Trametes cingulata]
MALAFFIALAFLIVSALALLAALTLALLIVHALLVTLILALLVTLAAFVIYALTVFVTDSCWCDVVPIDLPQHLECLPDIYKVPSHTLEPDFGTFKGSTYIVVMDDTEDARKSLKDYLNQVHIPQGTPSGIQVAGREEEDKVQVVVIPQECFSAASHSHFMQVRDTVLGLCGQQKPQKGGVFWEQSDKAKSLKNGHRAYLLTLSDQKAKQLT